MQSIIYTCDAYNITLRTTKAAFSSVCDIMPAGQELLLDIYTVANGDLSQAEIVQNKSSCLTQYRNVIAHKVYICLCAAYSVLT